MTLVITLLSHDYVVQASDRRLVDHHGNVFEDHENKALFLCGQTVFAYTGLARLSNEPTADWVLDVVQPAQSFDDVVNRLTEAATRAVGQLRLPVRPLVQRAVRRLAFVGAGFIQPSDPESAAMRGRDGRVPFYVVVSNFLDHTGRWLAEARDQFHPQFLVLKPAENFTVLSAGQRLPPTARKQLVRDITRVRRRTRDPLPPARLLIRQIKQFGTVNGMVGTNVMCCILPRSDVTPGDPDIESGLIPLFKLDESQYFHRGRGEPLRKSFIYVPGDGDAWPYFGPNTVCAVAAWKGMEFGPAQDARQRPV